MSHKEPEIIEVEPMDPNKKNSPIVESLAPEEEVKFGEDCFWNGARYSHCSEVKSGGYTYHCYSGRWIKGL